MSSTHQHAKKTSGIREVSDRARAEQRLRILADASTQASRSLSFAEALGAIPRIAVPRLADWCVLQVDHGDSPRTELAHAADVDGALLADLVSRSERRLLPTEHPVARARVTGEPQLESFVDAAFLRRIAVDGEQAEGLRRLGLGSLMVVPLPPGPLIGTLSFCSREPGRYGPADLGLAVELGHRVALALHSALGRQRIEQVAAELARAVATRDESLSILDTILATAPIGLAFFDRDLRYVRINERLASLNGVAPVETLGRTVDEVLSPEVARSVGAHVRQVLETREPVEGVELTSPVADDTGEPRHWLVSYYPVRGGTATFVGSVVVDITAQKQAQAERAELLDRERQAREEAEGANRAKDEFLAMLGHELRNPLSPILTALQIMDLRLGDQAHKERTIIERQVQHLVRLVDDLLDVSRITRGKIELKKRRVELGHVVAKAIEMASPLFEQRRHELVTSVPPRGLCVEGDEYRLSQVVANLLTNAAKYTEPDGRIEIRAHRSDGTVVLSVRDNGIGIQPALLERLFAPFVQSERSIDRAQGGLGLGLAIVRSLLDMHGGSVRAHSEGPGRGSEFVVELPFVEGEADRDSGKWTPVPRLARADSSGVRVLVVDDNRDAAEVLSDAIRALGHTTRAAFDGPGALRLAADFRPQVAFLDIGLPVMDGYELARRFRETSGLEDLVLVAVTGYGLSSDRELSRRAGFVEHLVKPVDIRRIEPMLRELKDAADARTPPSR